MKTTLLIISLILGCVSAANQEQPNLGKLVCEKAKNTQRMFEVKAKIIANKLNSLSVVHLEKSSTSICTRQDSPISDDGGERCTYECILEAKHGTNALKILLYEDFNKKIRLSKLEILSGS